MNNNYISLLLLGIYSGFLATIPIGPSKMLSVRNYLIRTRGNKTPFLNLDIHDYNFIGAITGLLAAQIYIILSIYFPILHSLWMKPHFSSILFVPLLFFLWNRIKTFEIDKYNTEYLESNNRYIINIQTSFLETFFIQLLNPIIFPNAVFSRLSGVFFFCYSNIFIFTFGIIAGLVFGYITFFIFTIFILQRLENDTPIIYRLVKRVIHQVFFPLVFVICLISLGRTPIIPIQNLTKELWKEKGWPDTFFNYENWSRPMRLLKNNKTNSSDENIRAFNKMYFSQSFFYMNKNNEKLDLSANYPVSISMTSQEIDNLLAFHSNDKTYDDNILDKWNERQKQRKIELLTNINNRVSELTKKKTIENILYKKLGSINQNGLFFSKHYDPRLNTDIYSQDLEFVNKSPLLISSEYLTEKTPFLSTEKTTLLNIHKQNRFKIFLSDNYKKIQNLPIVLWKDSLQTTHIGAKESETLDIEDNKALIVKEGRGQFKKKSWDNILLFIQGSLKLNREDKDDINQLIEAEDLNLINKTKLSELHKKLPLWNSKLTRADLQTPEPNEFRSILANFVRNLLPGAIRARRRKALAWNIYQNQAHSPIFLRATDSLKNINSLIKNEDKKIILMSNTRSEIQNNANILKSRWNFTIAHFVRGIALCSQAYIRRYIKIPIFIITKNITRQILLLPTEWQQDWKNLSQEIYVDCDYDGNDLYVGIKFPNIWELAGKQIKILQPFPFQYSNEQVNYRKGNDEIEKPISLSINDVSNYTLDNYSYLTIWGNETNEPFGKNKDSNYFWQPVLKRLNLIVTYKIYNQFDKIFIKFNWINDDSHSLLKIVNKLKNIIPVVSKEEDLKTKINQASNYQQANEHKISSIPNTEYIGEHDKLREDLISSNKISVRKNIDVTIFNETSLNEKRKSQIIQKEKQETKILKTKRFSHKTNTKIALDHNIQIVKEHGKIRKSTLQHQYINIEKKIFILNIFLHKTKKNLLLNLRKNTKNITRYSSINYINLKQLFETTKFSIIRYLHLLNIYLSKTLKLSVFELKSLGTYKQEKSMMMQNEDYSSIDKSNRRIYLSQASILHSIRKDELINKNNAIYLIQTWDHTKAIHPNFKRFLKDQNLVKNAENFTYTDFERSLNKNNSFIPSFKVWQHIVPQYWSTSVFKYWHDNSSILSKAKVITEDFVIQKENDSNKLNYHKPLFDRAEKSSKLSEFNTILKKYTDIADSMDFSIQKNRISEIRKQSENIFGIQSLITKSNLDNNFSSYPIQKSNSDLVSSAREIQENPFQFSKIDHFLLKKLPIIDKEIKRFTSNIGIHSLKERISYPATRENKWKFSELQNRFRNLMRIAKQRNVLKESLLDKKYGLQIPYEIRKDLNMFYKSFEPENMLFINLVENWRYKILDDELLTYEMVSSFLNFLNKKKYNLITDAKHTSKSKVSNIKLLDNYPLLPERILLPQNIRELRILENLNVNRNMDEYENLTGNSLITMKNHNNITINLNKRNTDSVVIKDYAINQEIENIMRFLWPTHRLEDLAFINRFWLSTSSQSKFSLLRIRHYPIY